MKKEKENSQSECLKYKKEEKLVVLYTKKYTFHTDPR